MGNSSKTSIKIFSHAGLDPASIFNSFSLELVIARRTQDKKGHVFCNSLSRRSFRNILSSDWYGPVSLQEIGNRNRGRCSITTINRISISLNSYLKFYPTDSNNQRKPSASKFTSVQIYLSFLSRNNRNVGRFRAKS